ncbi:putative chemotaxis protein CheA [Selenomonas sp. oral taxon 892 str. F0426]|uniref:chemotaxis protein CheA n=1 Tax=Selenomonas sp. oral taxon 892 TaxID=1321785 RepID=UPI0003AD60EB|nr:chemotaxis protein CheA [Selenomonas sp. oral taxon 892]ERJ95286.1 putative chemotaxis protein CheA [Selenomonas sp. oral taxon 892 str. F0426]
MDNQYMDMFLDESHEHLQSLNEGLLSLEENMEEIGVVNDIFRNAHTLKGMSATMGFAKIAELTHEMEDVLDLVRKEQLKLNEDIMDTLFKCLDSLEQMVDSVGNGEAEDVVDVSDLVAKLSSISKGTPAPAAATPAAANSAAPAASEGDSAKSVDLELDDIDLDVMKKAKEAGMNMFHVKVTLMETCVLKAARSVMVMHALDEIGDVIKSIPPAEDLEQEKFERSFDVVIATGGDAQAVQNAVDTVSEIEDVLVEPLDPDKVGKSEAPASATSPAPAAKAAAPAAKKEAAKPAAAPAKKPHQSQSVRVDIEKLDTLMNLMGELVINKVRLEQIGQTHRLSDLMETLEQMDRVTGDLQNIVMKVRMVPVSAVFNRFPRMVRDVSKELGKDINLTIEGEETELDRTVIDEIGDPIMHLLRNSLDHGVESPDAREAKGKPRTGEVGLIARHEGNNVVIMITDDGAGIDASKIRRKAVEKGMVTQSEADSLDDADAVRLIFLPGFSTAEQITDISGRGVGMDVVRSKIEALSGHVDVETHIDEGSVFKIKLPLTLAIIQAMLVRVQEEMYAIPLTSIDSTINIEPSDIQTVQNKEVIVLRGEIIPIIRMEEALQVPHTKDSDEHFVVVVHAGEAKAGIVVDNLIGQQEIVIKTLGNLFAGLKLFGGATVLGDGRVALILDVATMIQQ